MAIEGLELPSYDAETIQWDGEAHTANTFFGENYGADWSYYGPDSTDIIFPGPYGILRAKVGDHIVRSAEGLIYVVQEG